jgi:adenosylmethionine-8-amino-7-oxononanoate aminotransferase
MGIATFNHPTRYFMPPYVIQPEEIDFLAKVAWDGIDAATR